MYLVNAGQHQKFIDKINFECFHVFNFEKTLIFKNKIFNLGLRKIAFFL